jgi:hypothetical protein
MEGAKLVKLRETSICLFKFTAAQSVIQTLFNPAP